MLLVEFQSVLPEAMRSATVFSAFSARAVIAFSSSPLRICSTRASSLSILSCITARSDSAFFSAASALFSAAIVRCSQREDASLARRSSPPILLISFSRLAYDALSFSSLANRRSMSFSFSTSVRSEKRPDRAAGVSGCLFQS